MTYPDFLVTCGRCTALLLAFLAMLSCQSSGQEDADGGHFSRRKIPEHVMAALPAETDTLLQTEHFRFFGHGDIDSTAVRNLAEKSEAALERILALVPHEQKKLQAIEWHLYPTSEIKGLILKNTSPCQIDHESQVVHSVLNEVLRHHYQGKENELILHQLLGSPASANVLETGLAIHFTEGWQGYGYRRWAHRLAMANSLPPLAELFDIQRWGSCSELIFGSAAASFCDFLMEKWGREVFLANYTHWRPDTAELPGLEAEWKAYLQGISNEATTPADELLAPKLPYLKGFNFAHEGYRIYNGYGSRKAEQSLEQLQGMGANSVAIVPYSFLRNAKLPAHIPVVRQPGTENDESVIASAESAQSLGFAVVMKPQIWLGGGQWPGDIEMQSNEEWEQFFHCYNHWIVHYAMLAELYGWEMLCIGTEMVRTTLDREGDWRQIIQNVRRVYSGPITYAANWGDEFERTKLWDAVDYIGLNCYYPLSQSDSPSDGELRKGFSKVTDRIERVYAKYGKPVVFTEIGFPAIEAPWKQPHEDRGDFEQDDMGQRRCYEVVFEAIHGQPWCGGILWWKYPSDLEHRSRHNTGFTPSGRAAEAVVEKWFGRSR